MRMLEACRGRASQSSSLRREPAMLLRAPEGRDDCGMTKSTLAPRLATELDTLDRAPWPSAIMVTTAAIPMVMPMTVSPARSLFRRTIRSAMTSEDQKRESMSLVPEGHDGVEERGAPGREEAEEDADDHAR